MNIDSSIGKLQLEGYSIIRPLDINILHRNPRCVGNRLLATHHLRKRTRC